MTLSEFKNKYLGKQVEYHSYGAGAYNQCVDLINQYINDCLDSNTKDYTEIIGTNAKDFNTKYDSEDFEWVENTPLGIPQEGDIIVWNGNVGGGAGHVAIFLTGGVNAFQSLDQNWSIVERVTQENHSYDNIQGWLRPKTSTDNISIPKKDFENLVRKSTEYDKICEYHGLSPNENNSTAIIQIFEKTTDELKDCRTSASQEKDKLEGEIQSLKEDVSKLRQERDEAVSNVCSDPSAHTPDDSGDSEPPIPDNPDDNSGGTDNPPSDGQKNPIQILIDTFLNWFR